MSTAEDTASVTEQPEGFSELTRRALALYEEKLRAALEAEHSGRGLAIHPDSGDYIVAATPTHAGKAMLQRHPDSEFLTMRIGTTPEYQLSARILAGQQRAGRKR
jgi:hypothetical protein